jgi:hypothetical protein
MAKFRSRTLMLAGEIITEFKICRGLENFREFMGKMQGVKFAFKLSRIWKTFL